AREVLGDLHDAFFGNGAGDRAAVGGRNPRSDRYLSLVSLGDLVAQGNDAHEVVQRLLGAAAHVGLIVRLARRQHIIDLGDSVSSARPAPGGWGTGAAAVTPPIIVAPRATASASTNCATTFGGTNDVTSISAMPACAARRHHSSFCSVFRLSRSCSLL